MKSEPLVRSATITDAVPLARLATALGYPSTADDIEERLLALRYDEDHAVYVVVDDEELRGFAHVAVRPTLVSGLSVELLALVVDERARGRGLGRALLDRVHAFARERDIDDVRVCSNVVRERAHRFYEANGYTRAKVQVVLRRTL